MQGTRRTESCWEGAETGNEPQRFRASQSPKDFKTTYRHINTLWSAWETLWGLLAERLVALHQNRSFSPFCLGVKPSPLKPAFWGRAWGHYMGTTKRGASHPAPLPSVLFLAVWCHSSPLVPALKRACLHNKASACCPNQWWLFCLAEGQRNLPAQSDQGAEASAQAVFIGRSRTCAFKQ